MIITIHLQPFTLCCNAIRAAFASQGSLNAPSTLYLYIFVLQSYHRAKNSRSQAWSPNWGETDALNGMYFTHSQLYTSPEVCMHFVCRCEQPFLWHLAVPGQGSQIQISLQQLIECSWMIHLKNNDISLTLCILSLVGNLQEAQSLLREVHNISALKIQQGLDWISNCHFSWHVANCPGILASVLSMSVRSVGSGLSGFFSLICSVGRL